WVFLEAGACSSPRATAPPTRSDGVTRKSAPACTSFGFMSRSDGWSRLRVTPHRPLRVSHLSDLAVPCGERAEASLRKVKSKDLLFAACALALVAVTATRAAAAAIRMLSTRAVVFTSWAPCAPCGFLAGTRAFPSIKDRARTRSTDSPCQRRRTRRFVGALWPEGHANPAPARP